jgi:Tfp pilus assembly protein PilW
MRKLILFFAIFFLMTASSLAYIGMVRPTEFRQDSTFYVNVVSGGKSINDASVHIYMPDFDIYQGSYNFNLGRDKTKMIVMGVDLPEDAQGYYPVKVTLSNDEIRKTKYVWVLIE